MTTRLVTAIAWPPNLKVLGSSSANEVLANEALHPSIPINLKYNACLVTDYRRLLYGSNKQSNYLSGIA